jgi:hypothetical protein
VLFWSRDYRGSPCISSHRCHQLSMVANYEAELLKVVWLSLIQFLPSYAFFPCFFIDANFIILPMTFIDFFNRHRMQWREEPSGFSHLTGRDRANHEEWLQRRADVCLSILHSWSYKKYHFPLSASGLGFRVICLCFCKGP